MSKPEVQHVHLTSFVNLDDDRLRFREPGAFRLTAAEYAEVMYDEGGYGEFPPVQAVELTKMFSWSEEVSVINAEFGDPDAGAKRETRKSRLMYNAGSLVLWSGFARCAAALGQKELGGAAIVDVPCVVTPGTWEDAVRMAWTANARHGRPRSPGELDMILRSVHSVKGNPEVSAREIARQVGCSRSAVNRFRAKHWGPTKEVPVKTQAGLFATAAKDQWGRVIPTWLADEFRAVGKAAKAIDKLRKVGHELLALKYDATGDVVEPGLKRFDARELHTQLDDLARAAEACIPAIVCPACDGEGQVKDGGDQSRCETCLGEGLLLRGQIEALPPALERAARQAALPTTAA